MVLVVLIFLFFQNEDEAKYRLIYKGDMSLNLYKFFSKALIKIIDLFFNLGKIIQFNTKGSFQTYYHQRNNVFRYFNIEGL